MKYEKAKCEVISFDDIEFFMTYSNGSGTNGQQTAYSQIGSLCTGFNGVIDSNGNFSCTSFNHIAVGSVVVIKQTATGYQCLNFYNV